MLDRHLALIRDWYHARCDGDWEHRWGITIETLDNPGWRGRIAIEGTPLADRDPPAAVSIHRSDTDWLEIAVRHDETFEGRHFDFACGTYNLEECLAAFVAWAGLRADPEATAPSDGA